MQYVKCGHEKFEWEFTPLGKFCNLCKKEIPIVRLTTQNLKLCKECFNKIQEKRLLEAVKKFKMFSPEDRIGIFLSGGKDSATLAHLLKRLYPNYQIFGIYINLGIKYYSAYAQKAVEELCAKLTLPLYIYNLAERDKFSIDEFIFTNFRYKICSVCGTIKRYLFSKIARELELTVIATGHHLDDLISTYLTLFLNGDFISIKRLHPVNPPLFQGQAKKVKPLYAIPEKEIFYYAILNELPLESCGCPHGEITPSKKMKNIIENLCQENRTFKFQLLSIFLQKFIPLLRENLEEKENFQRCIKCGEFTLSSSGVCGFCRRKELLERVLERKLEIDPEEWIEITASEKCKDWVVFDVREKEDFLQKTLPYAKWLSPQLLEKERELYLNMRPYKNKKLLFFCYTGRVSYLFTLTLRKMGFQAYNLKDPEKIFQT